MDSLSNENQENLQVINQTTVTMTRSAAQSWRACVVIAASDLQHAAHFGKTPAISGISLIHVIETRSGRAHAWLIRTGPVRDGVCQAHSA